MRSAELGEALTRTLHTALPKSLARGFAHVNPVFRCNRFEPGDARFSAHVDSPYYDAARHQVSKYTLLLYLTGGRGEPAPRFDETIEFEDIEALSGFVFAQQHEHEGGPYVDGTKLFLRTELIYIDGKLQCEPGIAQLFAKACYLDGQSVFAPELARFAADAYNRAAPAHWQGLPDPPQAEPFVHKQFRGLHFVTNGYDYWFRKGDVSLIEGAALALLDALNGQIDEVAFHKLCESEVLLRDPVDRGWIAERLDGVEPPEPVFGQIDKHSLVPEPEHPDRTMGFPDSPDFSPDPFPAYWDASRNKKVIDAFTRIRRYVLERIFAAPLMILGKQLFLDRRQHAAVT